MNTLEGQYQEISVHGKFFTEEQLRQYNENGYVIIPGLLDGDEVKRMKDMHLRAEALAQQHGECFSKDDAFYDVESLPEGHPAGKTHALRKIQEVFKSEQDFADIMASKKIRNYASDLIGDTVYYHSSKLMCKPSHGGRRKPWHQDWAYWTDMHTQQVTVWIAIDAATVENGCMQVLPGSHKLGHIEHYQGEDFMIHEEQVDQDQVVIAEMNPGDALFFNVLTLHASDPNNSTADRLSGIIDFDSQP
ncbi:MAG: phytanoyl-CoA dioxygenase family protein, partial [Planctomycetes bacterium]|nr:phytanoyl-CoA dioxygenase family protein [Planctomycetota bacterium]